MAKGKRGWREFGATLAILFGGIFIFTGILENREAKPDRFSVLAFILGGGGLLYAGWRVGFRTDPLQDATFWVTHEETPPEV